MHNVVLCSEWSKDLYPENTGGKFTNLLHSNMNFSGENWSVALTDVVYTPDTWNNVRADSNDIQIRMKGFHKWGLQPHTLYGTKPYEFEVRGSMYAVIHTRDLGITRDLDGGSRRCGGRLLSYESEWMD